MPGAWTPPAGRKAYLSTTYKDDLAWAAAWLCRADASYCTEAVSAWEDARSGVPFSAEVSWDNALPQAALLLYSMGVGEGEHMGQYLQLLDRVLLSWMGGHRRCPGPDFAPCAAANGHMYYR